MKLLLDTHTFIWFLNGDEQLPPSLRKIIANISNHCFLSIASIWEIAIKSSVGKLHLNGGFDNIERFLNSTKIEILPITFQQMQMLVKLDYHHRDPFDRIIIAQSLSEDLIIVSRDAIFKTYTANLIW